MHKYCFSLFPAVLQRLPPKFFQYITRSLELTKLVFFFSPMSTAIRARVEKRFYEDGRLKYRVRVTKYYKSGRLSISKRINIEIRGEQVTCKCSLLQLRKTYLIQGKEDARKKSLFLDNYTFAMDWSAGGKKMAKLHKKKHICPKRIDVTWHG